MRTGILLLLSAACILAADHPPAPQSFSMDRLGAPAVSFSRYRGKILAAAFISTECPHCQNLTKILVPLAHEYAPRGVQFLECAFNEDAQQTMKEFLERFSPPFPVGYNSPAAVRNYLHYSILDPNLFVPHMQFLDRRGILRADIPGEDKFFENPEVNIRAELDKLLRGGVSRTHTAKK